MRIVKLVIAQKSFWNALITLLLFPVYLYFVQAHISVISPLGLTGAGMIGAYLVWIYGKNFRAYQIPAHYILAALLFMRVIAGNTIPIIGIVFILGVILFLIQEVICYAEYKTSEMMRQIIVSGAIFLCFLMYTYIFGSVFITRISPLLLVILVGLSSLNVAAYLLWMYALRGRLYHLGYLTVSILTIQAFIGLRVLPFTHLTQGAFLTLFFIFALDVVKDAVLNQLGQRKFFLQVIFISLLVLLLIFTSPI